VDSDGEAAHSGSDIVPRESSLAAFVELALGGEREWMGRDYDASAKSGEM
jgi:hypothetical protein